MTLFAKLAMALSLGYYALSLGEAWGGQILGYHNDIWEVFDLPAQDQRPPVWIEVLGVLVSLFTLGTLALAYRGANRILNGGPMQAFRGLARDLRAIAWGLLGFWLGYNLMSGAMPALLAPHVQGGSVDLGWDPLDIDIVFAILGVVLLAISQTLWRAWEAEDETRHFL